MNKFKFDKRIHVVTSMAKLDAALKRSRPGRVFYAFKYATISFDLNGKPDGWRSPMRKTTYPKLDIAVGNTLRVPKANTNRRQDCGAGVNVATRRWCIESGGRWNFHDRTEGTYLHGNTKKSKDLFLVQFTKKDVACLPTASNGKFRLFRCKVVRMETVTPSRNSDLLR